MRRSPKQISPSSTKAGRAPSTAPTASIAMDKKPHSVVVGGTRGHGRAWVRALCAKGHEVSVGGRRAPADSDRGLPGVRFFRADFSKPAGLPALFAKLS